MNRRPVCCPCPRPASYAFATAGPAPQGKGAERSLRCLFADPRSRWELHDQASSRDLVEPFPLHPTQNGHFRRTSGMKLRAPITVPPITNQRPGDLCYVGTEAIWPFSRAMIALVTI